MCVCVCVCVCVQGESESLVCLVVDDKCEMNASVLCNISFVRGVLFYVGIIACICKIVFIRFPIHVCFVRFLLTLYISPRLYFGTT